MKKKTGLLKSLNPFKNKIVNSSEYNRRPRSIKHEERVNAYNLLLIIKN